MQCEMKIASGFVNIFFVTKYSLDLMIVVRSLDGADALLAAFCVGRLENDEN